jgi:hypothetical protein
VVPLNSPPVSSSEEGAGEGERKNWLKSISKPESLSTSSKGLLGSGSSLAAVEDTEEERERMNAENRLLWLVHDVGSSSIDRSSSGFQSRSQRISLGSHSDSESRKSTIVISCAKGRREMSESSLDRTSIWLATERSGVEIVGFVQQTFLGRRLEAEHSVRTDGGTN